MQEYYGLDSTIGLGRTFGFRFGEVLPPLEKPVITSITKDVDMAGMRLEFAQFGDFDSFSVYRSDTPMDINNMPPPIVTGLTTMYYLDSSVALEGVYYYRVESIRGSESRISEELLAEAISIPMDYILAYDFNGDVLDKSDNALNGIKTGNASFVAGRKLGTQALEFINGCVQTPQVLPINSNQMTISFWMSTSQSDFGVIYEVTENSNTYTDTIALYLNDGKQNKVSSVTRAAISDINLVHGAAIIDSSYQHCVIEIDGTKDGNNEQRILINNQVVTEKDVLYDRVSSRNFLNYIMYIGQRNATSGPLKAKLQDFRIYNRLLTEDEILSLFNE